MLLFANALTALLSLLAAWFWYQAATTVVSAEEVHRKEVDQAADGDEWISGGITVDNRAEGGTAWDLIASLHAQARCNRNGALSAGGAALVQSALYAAGLLI